MRTFNTTGPVRADDHYILPPLARFNLDEIQFLIDQKKYFILHAPRQVGKTSGMLALMAYLNERDTYRWVVLELKIRRDKLETVQETGLEQTWFYMDRSAADEGHLLIFDRDPEMSWKEKIFKKQQTHHGLAITVWGM